MEDNTRYARLCRWAYILSFLPYRRQKRTVAFLSESWELVFSAHGRLGTQVFIFKKDNCLVICFAGSNEWKDWLVNFDFFRIYVTDPDTGIRVRVHRGFFRALTKDTDISTGSRILLSIRQVLKQRHESYDKLIITGHSLGGALALLVPLFLRTVADVKVKVVTFSAPRVSDWTLTRVYLNRGIEAWQHVHRADAVPHLPPLVILFTPTVPLAVTGRVLSFLKPWKLLTHHKITQFLRESV